MDLSEKKPMPDYDALKIIKKQCRIDNVRDIQKLDINKRNVCLKDLKEIPGLSIRQIERLIGMSRGIIQRV